MFNFLQKFDPVINKNANHILLAAFPKSASTFLMNVLSELLNYKICIFIHAFDRNEQDIYQPKLHKNRDIDTITHQHIRATESNLKYIIKYNLSTIVLTRKLEDCVFALRRHMYNEPHNIWWPMAYISSDFYKLDESSQYDFLIELFIPWYINFYVSWKIAEKEGKIPLHFVDFEQVVNNDKLVINDILKFSGIEFKGKSDDFDRVFSLVKEKSRITKKVNLPQEINELSKDQKDRIAKFTTYYPSIDFSSIVY